MVPRDRGCVIANVDPPPPPRRYYVGVRALETTGCPFNHSLRSLTEAFHVRLTTCNRFEKKTKRKFDLATKSIPGVYPGAEKATLTFDVRTYAIGICRCARAGVRSRLATEYPLDRDV